MSFIIEEPNRGERPRAAWAQQVTRAVNSLSRFAAPGLLFREGPTGSGVEPLPQNRRGRSGGAVPTLQPWTFRCTVSEDGNGDEVREGGWLCPRLQFGYRLVVGPGEHAPLDVWTFTVEELAQTADGEYFVVCNANDGTFSLVRNYSGAEFDYSRGIVAFHVGTVADGVQTFAPHMTPVFYYNV